MHALLRIAGFLPYLLVVFLNAFVDLGHKIIVQNTVFKTYDGQEQIVLTAVVNALILLPFILLFTPAGFLSDKYPKNRVMRYSAWLAVFITLLITLFYYLGWFWPAFAMTFLLAVQSAFYSPAKYGFIKELAGNSQLTLANGLVQAVTTVAILAGTFVFSILFEGHLEGAEPAGQGDILRMIAPVGWFLVLGSAVELVLAYTLPRKREVDEALRFDWQRYRSGRYLRANFGVVFKSRVIWLSIVGLSLFWAIAQVVLASFPAFAKEQLGVVNTVVIQGMMACAGIGIMLGSLVAGKVSRNHIETGLIPIGAFGVAATLILMPGLEDVKAHGFNFLALGLLGGFFIVPLNALIQFHAGQRELGRVLAANNLVQTGVMLAFLCLTIVFAFVGVSSKGLFMLLILVAFGGAFYTLCQLPQSLTRFLIGWAFSFRYRLRVIGFDNIPESGGVLMLGNHISWVDWAVLQIASPRPVRFVMHKGIYEQWYLKGFLDLFGVVPIAPGASKAALQTIAESLSRGEVVCLFPEGAISRNGQLGQFRRGYERAAVQAEGVILPFYLRGLWGSRFSRAGGGLKSLRRSSGRRDLIVAFGKPLPISTPAEALKKQVFELSVTSWQHYARTLPILSVAWLETARRLGGSLAATDSSGGSLSHYRLMAAAIGFSRRVKRQAPEQNVGLLLPVSTLGIVANMAVLLRGKTVVNLSPAGGNEGLTAAMNRAGIRTLYTTRGYLKELEGRWGVKSADFPAGLEIHYADELLTKVGYPTGAAVALAARWLPPGLLQRLFCMKVPPESTAAILFTGEGCEAKGVMLSHRNIMTNLKQVSDLLNTEKEDVVLAQLPLSQAFGLTVTAFMPLVEGIPLVCHPRPADGFKTAMAVFRHRVTLLCAAAGILERFVEDERVHPVMLESLRLVVAGGGRLAPGLRDAFKRKFNKEVYEGYGVTETTPVASANIPDRMDPRSGKMQLGRKEGTVGMPLPGTSCRIVDPDTLEPLPVEREGLILIGGAQVMLGYLEDAEGTAESVLEIDGERWYKTGDRGHIDQDGFLTLRNP